MSNPTEGAPMNDNTGDDNFTAMMATAFSETETPSLAGAVDSLMAANAALAARIADYEAQAKTARHARRAMYKATTKTEFQKADLELREALRAIRADDK